MKAEGDDEKEFESTDTSPADLLWEDDDESEEQEESQDDADDEDDDSEESEEESEEEESESGEEEQESDDSEESEEESEEEDDVDPENYDEPVDGKKKKKGEAAEPDPEAEPANETMARKMAKENGKKFKEAETARKTLEIELTREREAREKLERDLAETKKVKIRPMDDPEYQKLHSAVMTDVKESAELIDGVKDVPGQFGKLVTKYLAARKSENRDQDINALRAEIIEKCVVKDVPFDDMDEVEKAQANAAATKVLTLLRNNADKVQQALDLADKLTNDAEDGSFVLREREYTSAKGEIDPVLEGLGTLGDDLIEANPHAVESIVAALIRDNPKAKARATKLKADLTEVFVGLRPLTKAEVDKLKREGADVAEFEKERRKAHKATKEKIMSMAFHGIMSRPLVPTMAKKLSEFEGEKKSEEDEVDTLIRRTVKKGPKKKAAPKKEKAGTSARDALYGHSDYGDDDD